MTAAPAPSPHKHPMLIWGVCGLICIALALAIMLAFDPERVRYLDVSDMALGSIVLIVLVVIASRKSLSVSASHAKMQQANKDHLHTQKAVEQSLSSVFLSHGDTDTISLESEMQHDFRTPLNQLTGAADLLKQSSLSTEQLACINLIQNAAGQMLGVMEKMMACPLTGDREEWAREAFDEVEREMMTHFAVKLNARQRADIRILMVEDDRASMEISTTLLKSLGCVQVDRAFNGLEAVECCQQNRYDLIIMDCLMPKMSGYEAAAKIRTLPDFRTTKILALTASLTQREKNRALGSGMDDYYAKPVTRATLEYMLGQIRFADLPSHS